MAASPQDRNDAITAAYLTGGYSYLEMAEHFGVHLATVGRIVRQLMQQCAN
jgi:putative transposase